MIYNYHTSHRSPRTFYALKRGASVPTLKTVTDPGARAFVGVELEIEAGRAERHTLSDEVDAIMGNLATCETDDSLNDGFEIITQPATVPAFLKAFKLDELTDLLTAKGAKSANTSTCGLHVHYSRAALGASEQARDMVCAKLLVLMDKFTDQLIKFARRDWTNLHYAKKWGNFNATGENSTKKLLGKFKPCKDSGDRYHALNLTNDATIEFRIFNGTLNPVVLRATVELVEAMVEYCKTHTTPEVQAATWADVIGMSAYPELAAFCTAREIA